MLAGTGKEVEEDTTKYTTKSLLWLADLGRSYFENSTVSDATTHDEILGHVILFGGGRSRPSCKIRRRAWGEAEPEKTSSAAGAMHRTWISLKSVATSGDDHAILAECERGEDSAVNEYKETLALENDLTSSLRDVVTRQYREVMTAHDRIKNLRDTAKKS